MRLRLWRRDPVDRLADFSDLTKLAARIEVRSPGPEIERVKRAAREIGQSADVVARDVVRAFAKIPEAMSVFTIPPGVKIETPKPSFDPPGQKPKPPPMERSRE